MHAKLHAKMGSWPQPYRSETCPTTSWPCCAHEPVGGACPFPHTTLRTSPSPKASEQRSLPSTTGSPPLTPAPWGPPASPPTPSSPAPGPGSAPWPAPWTRSTADLPIRSVTLTADTLTFTFDRGTPPYQVAPQSTARFQLNTGKGGTV